MIRGIKFKIFQDVNNNLYKILKCINIKQYYWHIIKEQTEVLSEQKAEFFLMDNYSGEKFLNLITANHFIVFLKVQAYIKDEAYFNINTYSEFEDSSCKIIILIYDCEYIEIYAKDNVVIKNMYNNALRNFKEVDLITNNDNRTEMNIT